jgi:hypothetical protein
MSKIQPLKAGDKFTCRFFLLLKRSSQAQIKNQDFKGPDFFVVTGVCKKERKS